MNAGGPGSNPDAAPRIEKNNFNSQVILKAEFNTYGDLAQQVEHRKRKKVS